MTTAKNTALVDILLFAGTVALAWYEEWSAKDLLWGLWISSLVLGYSYILTSIVSGLLRGDLSLLFGSKEEIVSDPVMIGITVILLDVVFVFISFVTFRLSKAALLMALVAVPSLLLGIGAILQEWKGWGFLPDASHLAVRIVMVVPVALFLLGFFSIHFLGFHVAHGAILNGLFPLLLHAGDIKSFQELVVQAFHNYWPFILVSGLSRPEFYKTAFQNSGAKAMFYPYIQVIRMHLMIFIIGFMGLAGLSSFMLYAVLFIYFFPLGSFVTELK